MPDDPKAPEPIPPEVERWRELAEKVAKEQDPKKMLDAVEELREELDHSEALKDT